MRLSNSDFRWIIRVFKLLSVSFVQWGTEPWRPRTVGLLMSSANSPHFTKLHTAHTATQRGYWGDMFGQTVLSFSLLSIYHSLSPLSFKSWILLGRNHTNTPHSLPHLTHSEVGVWAGTQLHWQFWICNRSDRILFCSPNYYIISKSKRLLEELIHRIQQFESVD